jgi:hypothetical protein
MLFDTSLATPHETRCEVVYSLRMLIGEAGPLSSVS